MTDADFESFVDRLVVVAELFGASLSMATQLLYFQTLKDLDAADVDQALANCAQTCTFMPKPAEIRSRVANAAGGDPELAVEAAWLEYKRLAAAIGAYESPTLDATLADTLIAIFDSWEKACWTELSPEMWASKRKEFGRVYRLMSARGHTGVTTLEGFCARTNYARFGLAHVPNALPPGDDQREDRRRLQRDNVRHAITALNEGREAVTVK